MSDRPPRRPELVKSLLIDAAAKLISSGGSASIGAVADAAGVTKGAVQHHFRTRAEMILAMYETAMNEFTHALQQQNSAAPPALNYASTCMELPGHDAQASWRALLVSCVTEREVAGHWSQWIADQRSRDAEPTVNALLVRLAADGLWLSDVLGTYSIDEKERKTLKCLMEQLMTREKGKA